MSRKIAILGDGGWGTTLAILLSKKAFQVTVWSAFPEYAQILKRKRENVKFLPGIKIPEEIRLTSSISEALDSFEILIVAVPSQFMRTVLGNVPKIDLSQAYVVSVTKGIENETLLRMSEVIRDCVGPCRLGVLSGPTIAHEVARGIPTTAVSSSDDPDVAGTIQETFFSDRFRVYTNADVIGVELGGALKNIIAIAAGISDGLGFGTNTKAALLTRGLAEIVRLGVAMGSHKETFFGLSGLGDLATTCMSAHSRNRWLGEEIGKKRALSEIMKKTEMVVEGIATARSAYGLSLKYRVEMPIVEQIYRILYEKKDPAIAVKDLMTRSPKSETW